ncbi:DNA circularization protein [Variovorax sp. E3]|uniref:DNA circularization protein n=1 Tax=Variovorax sp. E3 TaxID=1914993 RepID=UPI0018DB27D1|nr:DNA circularization N-terminal domain-containing protein [Variovorax sp. E3]
MSWLDYLLPASFRGVPFQVHTIEVTAGDNVVLREYPFQDLPTVFRMGEAAEEIKFSAYVVGDDYIEQREALRDVLTGEGILVHPTAGSIRVFVNGKFPIKENLLDEGGMARFDLVFVRAESRRYPAGIENTESEAEDAAEDAIEAAMDDFEASFDLDSAAGWVGERVGLRMFDSIGAVWSQVGPVIGSVGEFASGVIGQYQELRQGFDGLLSSAVNLAAGISSLFTLPADLTPERAVLFQAAFSGLFDMGAVVPRNDFDVAVVPPVGAGLVMFGSAKPDVIVGDTAARADLERLMAIGDQFIETLAVAAYVQAGTVVEIADYDAGITMRRAVHDQCTRLIVENSSRAAPDALPATAWHDAVSTMHAAALKDLQVRSRDLVRMTTYTPQAWQPVWYISYRLFGTADYADEILGLNPHIRHPLLVPPGIPLRVLRRD